MQAIQARGSYRDRLSTSGAPARRKAKLLPREDLFVVFGVMGDRLKDLRDRALLLIGFPGGPRRSELLAVDCKDVEHPAVQYRPRRRRPQDRRPARKNRSLPGQGARNLAQRGSYRTRPCLSSRRSTRTGFSRSPLRRGSLFDRPETPGCGRIRSSGLFRPQPAGRIHDQRSPPAFRRSRSGQQTGHASDVGRGALRGEPNTRLCLGGSPIGPGSLQLSWPAWTGANPRAMRDDMYDWRAIGGRITAGNGTPARLYRSQLA